MNTGLSQRDHILFNNKINVFTYLTFMFDNIFPNGLSALKKREKKTDEVNKKLLLSFKTFNFNVCVKH